MRTEDAVWKYLDVSTSHVTPDDCDLLDRDELPLVVLPFDEGYWILVPIEEGFEDELLGAGGSRYLIDVLERAADLDCYWVKLDRDGNEYEDLRTYNW